MTFEVEKQERESSQNLVRRFSRRLKQSGILFRARKARFKDRPQSRQLQKRSALRKEERKKEKERIEKMGKS